MNEEIVQAAKQILVTHAKQMALELVEAALLPALEQVVAKSEGKFDDVLLATLKEPLKAALVDLIGQVK